MLASAQNNLEYSKNFLHLLHLGKETGWLALGLGERLFTTYPLELVMCKF